METKQSAAAAPEHTGEAATSVYSGLVGDRLVTSLKTLSISWDVYKKTWKTYAGLVLLIFASILIPFMVFIFVGFGGALVKNAAPNFAAIVASVNVVTAIIGMLLVILFMVWIVLLTYTATLLPGFANERARLGVVFKFTWGKFGSLAWVSFLYGVIVAFGMILFIIPGIIWGIYYSLAFYTCAFEDKRGMDALRKSKELVKGYMWTTIRRWGFWMYFSLLSAIIGNIPLLGFVWQIIAFFTIMPLGYIYWFSWYLTLKERKARGLATDSATGKQKAGTVLLLFGMALLFTILVIIGIASKRQVYMRPSSNSGNSNTVEKFEKKYLAPWLSDEGDDKGDGTL